MVYDNTNRGTLGRNTRREKDTHPEYSGKCDIEGKMYWISARVKEGQDGKFFSLSFRPQEQQKPAAKPQRPIQGQSLAEADDDIPF